MAEIYKIQLPDGKLIDFQGDSAPTDDEYKQISAASGQPIYTREEFSKSIPLGREFDMLFNGAKVGDQLNVGNVGRAVKLGDNEFAIVGKPTSGPIEAALVSAGVNAPASAAFLGAMGAASEATAPLRAYGIPGKAAAIGIPILSGLAASIGVGGVQRNITQEVAPGINEAEESAIRSQPLASTLGRISTSGFRPGGLVRDAAGKVALGPEILSRAVPAAAGAGIQGASELAFDQGEGAAGRIGMAALENAILNTETGYGRSVMNAGAKAVKPNKITSQLGNASTKSTVMEANAAANDIALEQPDLTLPQLSRQTDAMSELMLRKAQADVLPVPGAPKATEGTELGMFEPVKDSITLPKGEADAILSHAMVEPDPIVQRAQTLEGLAPRQAANETLLADIMRAGDSPESFGVKSKIKEANSIVDGILSKMDKLEKDAGVPPEQSFRNKPEVKALLESRKPKKIGEDKYVGFQDDGQGGGFELWNLPEDAVNAQGKVVHPKDSTVTRSTLEKFGYEVPKAPIKEVSAPIEAKTPGAEVKTPGAMDEPVKATEPAFPLEPAEPDAPAPYVDKNGNYVEKVGNSWKIKPTQGSANPGPLGLIASPAIGGAIGYQFGDTPEEKRRNAIIGAAIAGGGSIAAAYIKTHPEIAKAVQKAMAEDLGSTPSSKEPSTFEAFTGATKAQEKPVVHPSASQPIPQGNLSPAAKSINKQIAASKPKDIWEQVLKDNGVKDVPKDGGPYVGNPPSNDAPDSLASPAVDETRWTPYVSKTSFGQLVKKVLGTVEDNVRAVSKPVFGLIRQRADDINTISANFQERTLPLSRLARKNLKAGEFEEFSIALLNGDIDAAKRLVSGTPDGPEIIKAIDGARTALDDAHAMLEESRPDDGAGYVQDFFPRKVSDYKGFREFLGKEAPGAVEAALKKAREEKGGPLTQEQEEAALNALVSGSFRSGGGAGFLKARTVEQIQKNWGKFYEPFDVSMEDYLNRVTHDIVNRAYFGKFEPGEAFSGQGGNFGKTLLQEVNSGKIGKDGQDVVIDNLNALLNHENASRTILSRLGSKIRLYQTAAFLGDFTTAVAQFGDAFSSAQRFGLTDTVKGYTKNLVGKDSITLPDLKVHEGNVETSDFARDRSFLAKATNRMLKFTIGFSDQFNKQGAANVIVNHFHNVASKPESSAFKRLENKYKSVFPDRWPKMVQALKNPELVESPSKFLQKNDDARFFVFNELADMHPLGPSQMAQGYNESNSLGKALYGLKSYMIKQMNIMRTDGYEKMRNPETFKEGLAFLATYAAIVAGGQAFSVSWARDKILDRKTEPEDYFFGSLLQLVGLNRYMLYKAKEGEFGKLVAESTLPILNVGSDIVNDAGLLRDMVIDRKDSKGNRTVKNLSDLYSQSELVKYAPVVGRSLYSRTGKGAEKEKERQKQKASGQSKGDLQIFEDVLNPPDKKSPRKN